MAVEGWVDSDRCCRASKIRLPYVNKGRDGVRERCLEGDRRLGRPKPSLQAGQTA